MISRKTGVVLGTTTLIILASFSVACLVLAGEDDAGHDVTTDRVAVFPACYFIEYRTWEEALEAANARLSGMKCAPVNYIDGDSGDFTAMFYLDHEMGNILYWELSSGGVEVCLNPYSGEIIRYWQCDYYSEARNLTQVQIEEIAEEVADELLPGSGLPREHEEPWTRFRENAITYGSINDDTGEETTTTRSFWRVRFNRTKDSITTTDHIEVSLDRDGNLRSYRKVWYMDLDGLNTDCRVSGEEAENAAIEFKFKGQDCSVRKTEKMIVRPDYYWIVPDSPVDEEGYPSDAYGLDPRVVWAIHIEDAHGNLCIFHVDGMNCRIIGGDSRHNCSGFE